MSLQKSRPTTPGYRHRSSLKTTTTSKPYKPLLKIKRKITGRNNQGKITVRHRGGGEKRYLRKIDFRRDKRDITGIVETIEYDPNRTTNIALIRYADGERRYILAPEALQIGFTIVSGTSSDVMPGNAMPLRQIPVGTPIHNIEITPGKGGQMIRSAGSSALIQSKEGRYATVMLPSKELRLVDLDCYATIGQLSNPEWKNVSLGKAGRRRHMGWRPTVRGVAQHPDSHPHGGGEGRSGIGLKASKTPWGKRDRGVKTRTGKKYSDRLIVSGRKKGK